jgi:hypothetical protein
MEPLSLFYGSQHERCSGNRETRRLHGAMLSRIGALGGDPEGRMR